MEWPKLVEDDWQLFAAELDESSHGFFLIKYDRAFTYQAIVRRLSKLETEKNNSFIRAKLADRFVDFIENKLQNGPIDAVIIHLDESVDNEKLKALNLIRERLFELPTNFVFLTEEATFARLLQAARDFATWIKLPYEITLPSIDFPDFIFTPKTPLTSEDQSRIDYFTQQIQQALDENQREKAYQLLPALADLYLETELFVAACSIFKALASYHEISASDTEQHRFQEKLALAEGWCILADLNLGRVGPEEQKKLKQLIDNGRFRVKQTKDGLAITDSSGRSKHFAMELFVRLSLLSEQFQQQFKEITQKTADPTFLSLDAEKAYTYSAARYGMGYDTLRLRLTIREDGSAEVYRYVDVEAYSQIDSLDTYLLKNDEDEDDKGSSKIELKGAKSLSLDRVIRIEDKRDAMSRLSSMMIISPQLSYGDRLTYEMREEAPPGLFAVDRETLQKREDPHDYFGWNINRPTRRLILEVYFPKDCIWDKYESEVRYADVGGYPSPNLQLAEKRRLQEPKVAFANQYPVLRLEVEYPMTGLIYILRWG